ncbi:MAG: BACON domain-containing carbohydrate-binding protein [Terracidiphilus sp.]
MNLWPTDGPFNPNTSDVSLASLIRVAGGQVTVFDQNGNSLPMMTPNASIPTNWPLKLLGSNPGPSILSSLVVPNIQTRASALNAALTLFSNPEVASLAVPLPKGGASSWTYAQSGSNWIAQSVMVPLSTSQISSNLTMQFADVNWSDNAANDAARAALGSTMQAPPTANAGTPDFLPAPPPPIRGGPIEPTNCNTNTYNLGGAQNIVLMHGIWSNSCAWTRMANWLNQDFLIGKEVIPSLDSNAAIDGSQGPALISEIKSVGGSNYILIGHSQGGLVSRSAAQYFQNNAPFNISEGVVTVDTPHDGANLTLNTPLAISAWLDTEAVNVWEYDGCGSAYDNYGCWLAALMFSAGTSIEPVLASGVGSISWSQLQPGSTFLSNLNAAPENFKQAAVIGLTPQRFAFTRIAANAFFGCNPEDGLCGERAIATDTEVFYDALLAEQIYYDFESTIDCSNGDEEDCEYDIEAASFFGGFMSIMDNIDGYYNAFIDLPGDGSSDGIVQGPSQYYPHATAVQYTIGGADSHTGALKSSYVHAALDAALTSTLFNVPTPASCAFSVSGSPYSTSANAAGGSFAVSAGEGCQWSAWSQTPWLSVTSGVYGTSTGAVEFSVAANPSTVPRQGSIQVGNRSSSALFTVDQSGLCAYSLSGDTMIAVPPGGASSTVQVNTTIDCPWSAVSNANWLTITSGASGTGSGSFIWTAAPNTGTSDRNGSITVMGQVINFVDGISVGTPGQGTVTIYGYPENVLFYPCGNLNCPVTIPETGDVIVTVGGVTFEAPYSSSATMVASELASTINYLTNIVSATASGTTVTITSTLNGTGTNYPLAVAVTFGPTECSDGEREPCATSPAFYATTPFGPSLTGGTN